METIARQIVAKLFEAGFIAYYAGGFVRDLLLGEPSHEIDIATSAPPAKVCELFSKTIEVGAQFGVIVVVEEGHMFEVTTFRRDHPYHDGRHPEGVDFSTPEKDAMRRDFTINGMFYNPLTEEVHDYVEGQKDLKAGIIRAIGDPDARFAEDRLRMLRAVRFATRLGFTIEPETEKAIRRHAHTLLPAVSVERIWQELVKMTPHLERAIVQLLHLDLLECIFPGATRIEEKVAFFPYYPLDCPTIIYLHTLAPEQGTALCDKLKTSAHDRKLIEFFMASKQLFQTEPELAQWAHFYAHPHAQLFLDIEAAHTLPPKRAPLVEEHQQRQKTLAAHIKRIASGHPLLTSSHLKKAGISPGKAMGELLREGERLTINENLSSADEVITRLKTSSLWPK